MSKQAANFPIPRKKETKMKICGFCAVLCKIKIQNQNNNFLGTCNVLSLETSNVLSNHANYARADWEFGLGICGNICKLIMIDALPKNAHITIPNYLVDG